MIVVTAVYGIELLIASSAILVFIPLMISERPVSRKLWPTDLARMVITREISMLLHKLPGMGRAAYIPRTTLQYELPHSDNDHRIH